MPVDYRPIPIAIGGIDHRVGLVMFIYLSIMYTNMPQLLIQYLCALDYRPIPIAIDHRVGPVIPIFIYNYGHKHEEEVP